MSSDPVLIVQVGATHQSAYPAFAARASVVESVVGPLCQLAKLPNSRHEVSRAQYDLIWIATHDGPVPADC